MGTIGGIVKREMQLLRLNLRTVVIAIIAPLLFALIVGSIYSAKKLIAVPIVIIDQDYSVTSRGIADALLAAEPFVPGPAANSAADFNALAAEGAAHVCFMFPPHFERDLKSGKAPRIVALIDTSNLATGNVAATATASVLTSYSVGIDIRKMRLRGIPEKRARETALPLSMQTRTLFNPALNGNYANSLVIGFIAIAVQLSGLLAVTQARTGAQSLLLPTNPIRLAAVIHVAVIAAIVSLGAWSTVRMTIHCLEIPMRGNEWLLAFVILWFTANLAALGFGISCLARDPLFASQLCAIITMPNFLISGFTWPVLAMPHSLQVLAYALPMNPFAFALRKITLMGAGFGDLGFEFGLLAVWSLAAAGLAAFGASRMKGTSSVEGVI